MYEPISDSSHGFPAVAIEIESILRHDGHLVFYDSNRKGLWYFQLDQDEDAPNETLDRGVQALGYTLCVTQEGTYRPSQFQKGRTLGPQSMKQMQNATSTISGIPAFSANSAIELSSMPFFGGDPPSSQQPSSTQIVSRSEVYESFVIVILLAITTGFCPVTGAIPLNYRTVLLPSGLPSSKGDRATTFEHGALMGTFGAHLTTAGSLIISLNASHCQGLLSLDNFFAASLTAPGQRVLAAPFGVHASKVTTAMGELGTVSLAQTPNTQILSTRGYSELNDGLWKQACLKILQLRGIPPSILENCSWVTVSVARRRLQEAKPDGSRPKDGGSAVSTMIPWPGSLCFRQRTVEVSSTNRLGDNILIGREEHRDPLDRAGRWFDSAAERDERVSRRRADRAALASTDLSGGIQRPPAADGQPSLTVGRPNAVLTGAMYPTPPDGIQQPSGITPMFDTIVSSPRNQPSAAAIAAAAEIEEAMQNDAEMTNPGEEEADPSEAKRDRSDSNLLVDAENMLMGGGDIFGDDADITEADFNFFDEQPEPSDIPMADVIETQDTVSQKQTPIKVESIQLTTPRPEPITPVQLPPESSVFMKPELKDARSFQNDPQSSQPATEEPAVKVQEPSPFNDLTVFRQLRAALVSQSDSSSAEPEARKRKASVFERLDFGSILPMINKKYEKGGLFDFDPGPSLGHAKLLNSISLPETEYLKRHGKRNRKPRELNLPSKALMARFTALGASTSHPSPSGRATSLSDDDQSSTESDQDDSSYTSDEPGSPFKSSMRRLAVDDEAASNITSFREPEGMDEADQRLALELPRLTRPEVPEISLSRLFRDSEPLNVDLPLSDDDMIQIAQLVAEQAATGSLVLTDAQQSSKETAVEKSGRHDHNLLTATVRQGLGILQDILPPLLGRAAPTTLLKSLVAVQEVPIPGQGGVMQPRPLPGREAALEQVRPNALYPLPFHHLEVRRSDTKLSMLPTAISFWESLGLGPVSGSKNVHSVCVFPAWSGMMDSVKTFFERMKSIYELLKLGTFDSMPLPLGLEDGLLPYEVDKISTSPDASVTKQGSTLIESLDVLHTAIEDFLISDNNIVVFMVYTSTNPGSIVECCLAFQRFFEEHKKVLAVRHEYPQNELVLQLVSADLISSPSSLVVTPTSDLFKLCIEAYDRCTLFDGPMPAPGIVLEPSLPRLIDFKLAASPSASLMYENSCIYVAYAQSLDERWVAAAWTDEVGTQQATAAYCLGRKGRPLSTSMSDIAHEMWVTTLELTSHRKVHWRINITKSGPMDASEIEFWSGLAKTENKANVALSLMTVDTSPCVQLIPPAPQVPLSNASMYTTPVSTPQGNVVSPEASATPMTPHRDAAQVAATPSAEGPSEPEGTSTLVDVTDQTWAVVLGYRLNNSTTLLDLQPALTSGYLIKKTGARLQDAPAVLEVNLIHIENSARSYEPLFREVLYHFKGLGTLARARGMVDKETDVRPWHVAAAEKAVRALYMLM